MEKAIMDFFFSAFIVFHREIGLLVIVLLILLFMSGRRPNPWTYTGVFIKVLLLIMKKSLRICEAAAKETASIVPTKYAKWRPMVKIIAQVMYCAAATVAIVLLVSRCSQT
jgi:hypothetical protein